MPAPTWRQTPISGAPDGTTRRKCKAAGHTRFYVVRAFHGIHIYQCLDCRRIATVETRTGKTCLHCGEPLTGRRYNWCSAGHEREFTNSFDRGRWADRVKERDHLTCQRCGWHATPELEAALEQVFGPMYAAEMKKHWRVRRGHGRIRHRAMAQVGYRQLEAHHITPLEWGGHEFDPDNGQTLCHLCHDEVHRELNRKEA